VRPQVLNTPPASHRVTIRVWSSDSSFKRGSIPPVSVRGEEDIESVLVRRVTVAVYSPNDVSVRIKDDDWYITPVKNVQLVCVRIDRARSSLLQEDPMRHFKVQGLRAEVHAWGYGAVCAADNNKVK
jgi:hypothetical protein